MRLYQIGMKKLGAHTDALLMENETLAKQRIGKIAYQKLKL
jgi:hypothetical protein